jgi:hypothetical protein
MFSSFKEINMDWNNLVGNFNDFALARSLLAYKSRKKLVLLHTY